MMNTDWIAETIFLAYVLGSIPFGLVLTRVFGVGDIRKIGSGNIGATNVMRTGRKGLAIATLLLDAAKGFAAVALARDLFREEYAMLAGLIVVLGHVFPVWLRFKGGKGVATAFGVFFAVNPFIGLAVVIMWLAAFLCMRISSVAALLSIGYSAIAAYLISGGGSALLCLFMAIVITYTHRGNIRRLLDGTELHFSEKVS